MIGAYASALLSSDLGWSPAVTIPCAGVITAVLGTLLVYPAFRLRGHYVSIATLGIGEVVSLVILNWDGLTRGPLGITGIAPLPWATTARAAYWFTFAVLVVFALVQVRLLRSHLGRTLRAVRGRRRRACARHRTEPLQGNRVRGRRRCGRRERRDRRAPAATSITRPSIRRCRSSR